MGKLDNKVAVITGGNSGIGLASAYLFQEEGAKVIITARNEKRHAEIKNELGDAFEIVQADVAQVGELHRLFQQVAEKHGKIDVLFLNAGVAFPTPLDHADEATFDHIFNVNVKGVYFGVQKALPYLNKGASVILTTSVSNQKGMAGMSIYAASKAAVRSMAQSLSAELVGQGIRVNAISPGPVETPIYSKMGLSEEQLNGFAQGVLASVPLNRFGNAREIAGPALFLASDESSYILGEELVVDGGMAFA